SRVSRALTTMALVFLSVCGGKDTPTGPVAGATPTPSPTPTATPPPATSPALTQSCRALSPTSGSPSGCSRRTGNFFNQMRDAVNATIGASYRDPITGQ